ncbi:aryl-sulfate sulfotransferase [Pseudomonadota bacterium]
MRHLKTGLLEFDQSKATAGYTLFTPLGLTTTYLIDMHGEVVHEWQLENDVGNYAYLLPNGNLLAAIRTTEGPQKLPAKGGKIQELDWDGNVVWEHVDHAQHHDFRRRANGNTIYAGWELMPEEAHGRVRGGMPGTEHEMGIYSDYLREVNPAGDMVWEWRALVDQEIERYPIHSTCRREEFAHMNTVCPLDNGDVIVNWRFNNLMAIIDRDTKKFKWELVDLSFGQHHDVQMLDNGNILFFANGADTYQYGPEVGSRAVELDPKTNEIVWQYGGSPGYTMFSWFISGVQRLASGNTLICEGLWGRIIEVTPGGEIVWEYVSPIFNRDHFKYKDGNYIFRAYRYAADSPEIAGRLPANPA